MKKKVKYVWFLYFICILLPQVQMLLIPGWKEDVEAGVI